MHAKISGLKVYRNEIGIFLFRKNLKYVVQKTKVKFNLYKSLVLVIIGYWRNNENTETDLGPFSNSSSDLTPSVDHNDSFVEYYLKLLNYRKP